MFGLFSDPPRPAPPFTASDLESARSYADAFVVTVATLGAFRGSTTPNGTVTDWLVALDSRHRECWAVFEHFTPAWAAAMRSEPTAQAAGLQAACYHRLAMRIAAEFCRNVRRAIANAAYKNEPAKRAEVAAGISGYPLSPQTVGEFWPAVRPSLKALPPFDVEQLSEMLLREYCIARAELFGGASSQTIEADALAEYSPPMSPKEIEKRFQRSWDTLKRWIRDGKIRVHKLNSKSYRVHNDDLPAKR